MNIFRNITKIIFNEKNARKEALYPKLLKCARVVLKQVDRALENVKVTALDSDQKKKWLNQVKRYRDLTVKVISQTERRVIRKESVHSSEKNCEFIRVAQRHYR